MSYPFFSILMNRTLKSLVWSLSVGSLFFLLGCGYHFQSSTNPLYFKEGVQKVFVAPTINNTYKAGVENLVYNNLIRVISAHKQLTLVRHPEEADAIFAATIQAAFYSGSGSRTVENLAPVGIGAGMPSAGFTISTEYTAFLSCLFELTRSKSIPGKKNLIWTAVFTRPKPFPGSNQLDVPGVTSALINESEFDRALADISRSMMEDVHESMLSVF